MDQRPVRPERTGWRDQAVSERHRHYGYDLPMVDMDFVVVEYDHARVVALVELKNEHAAPQDPKHKTYVALGDFARDAGRPFFAVRYSDDFWTWLVVPLNDIARKWLPRRRVMTEIGYVGFLYHLRRRSVPAEVLAWLRKEHGIPAGEKPIYLDEGKNGTTA